jgi:L,D-peptidoglycan transpeptidase YkuD (ErfK/YbiS/YcfS/YnhG family)
MQFLSKLSAPWRNILLAIIIVCSVFNLSFAQNENISFDVSESTLQVILVTTRDWNSKTGKLQRFNRSGNVWKKVGNEIPVAVGKNGLAWGKGIHKRGGVATKKEGDGKAPAGMFTLGTMFGYSEKSPVSTNYPYRQSTARDYFVDDVTSSDYNQWVSIPPDQPNKPEEQWKSFERMKRQDHLYEYGIVINYNVNPAEKGKGSAIFFHIWRSEGSPTLGCTAMSKENLLSLMKWLDATKNPVLIQSPETEVNVFFRK